MRSAGYLRLTPENAAVIVQVKYCFKWTVFRLNAESDHRRERRLPRHNLLQRARYLTDYEMCSTPARSRWVPLSLASQSWLLVSNSYFSVAVFRPASRN